MMKLAERVRLGLVAAASAAAVGILGPCFGGGAARAQGPAIEGATLANRAPDAGEYLGNVYKDEAQGFKITPPVDARKITKAGGIDLLTFVQDAKASGGTLQRVDATVSLDDYVETSVRELNKTFKAVQVQARAKTKFQEFPAMRLTTTMVAELGSGLPSGVEQELLKKSGGRVGGARTEEVALLRQQLIVQTKENGFMVLTYYAPLRNRDEATKTFDAVAGSFEILNRDELRKKRVDAILAGKKWLEERTAEEFSSKVNPQLAYFRMVTGGMNGTDVGYWWQEEHVAQRDGFTGAEIQVKTISFPPELPGAIVQAQNVAFWANSRNVKGDVQPHYSMWDNTTVTQVKLPNTKDPTRLEDKEFFIEETGTLVQEGDQRLNPGVLAQLRADREKFIREHPDKAPPPPIPEKQAMFRMLVKLRGDAAQRLPEGVDKLFPSQEAAALPKVFEYVWPRLVVLNKPSEMSFAVYNSGAKKLTLRNLIVTGKKEPVTVNGRTLDCWKCIDELDPGSTTIWVDDAGRTVLMRTSDQSVMIPTTRQDMDRMWGARVRALQK